MPITLEDIHGLFALHQQIADAVQRFDARLGSIEQQLTEITNVMANDAIQQAAAAVSTGLDTLQTDAQTAYAYLQTQLAGPDDIQAVSALSAQVQQMDSTLRAAIPAAFPTPAAPTAAPAPATPDTSG